MAALSSVPTNLPLWQRFFYAIPVIGWIARDLIFGDKNNFWFALIMFVSLWMISALTFGLPGLYIPAVALVPIIFTILMFITWS
ncbi:MAG: hypothetical protein AB8B58_04515 [Roseobacter sp.]